MEETKIEGLQEDMREQERERNKQRARQDNQAAGHDMNGRVAVAVAAATAVSVLAGLAAIAEWPVHRLPKKPLRIDQDSALSEPKGPFQGPSVAEVLGWDVRWIDRVLVVIHSVQAASRRWKLLRVGRRTAMVGWVKQQKGDRCSTREMRGPRSQVC